MRIVIAAIGRLKRGAEQNLAERYRERVSKAGRSVGIRALDIVEIAESRARDAERRATEESIALANVIPDGAAVIVLHERGENLDSVSFTARLRALRDSGRQSVAFIVGGPDGLARSIHDKAELRLAFGSATWPHQLVRVMLLEQLYRAVTILSGHPYHRE